MTSLVFHARRKSSTRLVAQAIAHGLRSAGSAEAISVVVGAGIGVVVGLLIEPIFASQPTAG